MTERDTFELRLAAAVHAYAGRVSTDLDPVEFVSRQLTQQKTAVNRRVVGPF